MNLIRTMSGLRKAMVAIATLAFAAVFMLFLVGVGFRYIGGTSLSWTTELAVILFLWSMFFGAALAVPVDDHVRVDLLTAIARGRTGRVLSALALAATGLLFLVSLPWTHDYLAFLWRERTPALRWRLDLVYFCYTLFQGCVGVGLLVAARRRWQKG
ncbi:MAG: TRAP transporter small permease subunit [Azospirillaceae bacterium]